MPSTSTVLVQESLGPSADTWPEFLRHLTANIGKQVIVQRRALHPKTVDHRFTLMGTLEVPEDREEKVSASDEWYIRIGESYHGPCGIAFTGRLACELVELLDGTLLIILR